MPNIIQGNMQYRSSSELLGKINYDYEYPNGLDLRPGSKLHKRLKDKILENARESSTIMTKRHGAWNEMDRVLTTYIEIDEDEEDIKLEDSRKPVSIVFPYSYAILESLLAYLVAAFFQSPLFRYEGRSPEDTIGAIFMEKLIEYQMYRSKVELGLHTMFRDSMVYGMGVVAPMWETISGYKTIIRDVTGRNLLGLPKVIGQEKVQERGILYEGNVLRNVDIYKYLPDPNVSVHEHQRGEYNGWIEETNLMNLLSQERDGDFFNVKYLKHLQGRRTAVYTDDPSRRDEKSGMGKPRNVEGITQPVDNIWMYINLIPKDEGLGTSEYPEKWLFCLSSDEIIIQAKPLGLDHNMYPVAVSAPDFDGHSASPISRMETIYGLQGTLDWLFNSHIANVRKAINDMFVVDPYMLNMRDVEDPRAGKLIRMRRPGWGKGVDGAIKQLAVQDITRGNVADSAFIVEWMQKVAGADNPVMGNLRKGGPERLTSAEFQGTAQGAVNRLERVARIIGLQAMQDLGYMFASHTQQLMSESQKISVTGRWQETLIKEFGKTGNTLVDPKDILVDYDIIVRDGSVPGSNFSQIWIQMFQALAGNPELAQQFDIGRIFKHIARNAGAKNVDEFMKIKVAPDEQVMQQAEAGNVVPLNREVSNV